MSDDSMTALERMHLQSDADADATFHWEDSDLNKHCPQLFEILSKRKTPVGEREPGRLSVFVDEGNLKCLITCPSEARIAFVTLDRLYGLFDRLEDLIVSGKIDWRKDKRNGNGAYRR